MRTAAAGDAPAHEEGDLMRHSRLTSVIVLTLLALTAFGAATALGQAATGGRPPQITPYPTPDATLSTPAPAPPTPAAPVPARKVPSAFMPVSLFGMNLYLTGLERSDARPALLGALAAQGGVKWSREELSWANIEPHGQGPVQLGHLRPPPGATTPRTTST